MAHASMPCCVAAEASWSSTARGSGGSCLCTDACWCSAGTYSLAGAAACLSSCPPGTSVSGAGCFSCAAGETQGSWSLALTAVSPHVCVCVCVCVYPYIDMLYSCFTPVVRRCYYFSLYYDFSLSLYLDRNICFTLALLIYIYIYTPALLLFLFLCVYHCIYVYICFTPALLLLYFTCVCVCIRIWRVVEKKLFILRHLALVFTGVESRSALDQNTSWVCSTATGVPRLKLVANALLLLYIARLYQGTWRWCSQGLLD
jgi:hypothetical protein